jgi:hypothetical protein
MEPGSISLLHPYVQFVLGRNVGAAGAGFAVEWARRGAVLGQPPYRSSLAANCPRSPDGRRTATP